MSKLAYIIHVGHIYTSGARSLPAPSTASIVRVEGSCRCELVERAINPELTDRLAHYVRFMAYGYVDPDARGEDEELFLLWSVSSERAAAFALVVSAQNRIRAVDKFKKHYAAEADLPHAVCHLKLIDRSGGVVCNVIEE